MSAINFVVRDVAGNISRGSVAGEGEASPVIVGAGADVSLNLSRGQVVAYTRQGQALEVTLIDGRTIVIEGFFTAEGVSENQLFLSADGFLTEVQLNPGAGADYFANYVGGNAAVGKFAANEDLYFMRSSDVMLADSFVPEDDAVGMLGGAIAGIGPILGWGGAAVVGAATLAGAGGGNTGPAAPVVDVTSGTEGTNHVVNEEDYNNGIDIGGTGTPGATVDVTINDVTETTTIGEDGTWGVIFAPGDVESGEYTTPVEVTVTNDGGKTTVTDTLVVDTIIGVDMEMPGGDDQIINAEENAAGVTLSGGVLGGDAVVVTIDGVDYDAVVDGDTWTLDLPGNTFEDGEYIIQATVRATDEAGNAFTHTGMIGVDTVTTVTVDTSNVGGADTVVNNAEQSGGITLNGTAQSGATVAVTFGTVTQVVTANGDGTWSATYGAGDVPGGEQDVAVSVVATDVAGNTATASGVVTVDTLVTALEITSNSAGGDDGIVNFDESGQSITMTGTVEVGSSVSVELHGVVMQATVSPNGNWTVTYPGGTLPGGEYDTTVTVTATDAAGNTSSLSDNVTVDTVAGDLALSTQPIEIDDVVNAVEHSDGVIVNGTATAGLTVTVGLGDATMDVVAGSDGTWSVNFTADMIPEGTYESAITASITDAAGNYKEVSDTVQIDTEVVPFNFSSDPVEGDDVINAAEAANGVVLSGQVEAGSSVVVDFGGQSITAEVGVDGAWSATFPASAINNAEYDAVMTATATDAAGNVSVITDSVQVDTLVNELTTTDPVEGDNVVNGAEAADGVTLGGTVEAGSSVMVTFAHPGGVITQAATVDASGNWSVTYAGADVPAGEYDANITIAATDANGNTDSITDTFKVDTVAPEAPAVESVTITPAGVKFVGIDSTDNDITVNEISDSGTATQLATDADGQALPWGETLFNFDPVLSNGSHLVVNETDGAGNANATYVVLEEKGTNVVDLIGLDGFDIGAIDLSFAKDAELTLDLGALSSLSDANNNLVIHGGNDDAVTLTGAVQTDTTAMIGDKSYDIYTMGDDAQIYIEEDVNVTI